MNFMFFIFLIFLIANDDKLIIDIRQAFATFIAYVAQDMWDWREYHYITEFSNVWKFIAENLKDLDNIIG